MIMLQELTSYLHNYLSCYNFQDFAPNGLQVEGRREIKRICTAVTASQESINAAIEYRADALLVHHGFFWRGEDSVITGIKKQRIAALLKAELNLMAYHLPLDDHPELGNNVLFGKLLNLTNIKAHKIQGQAVAIWTGDLLQVMPPDVLRLEISRVLQRDPLHVAAGLAIKPITRVAWCTGSAHDFITHAKDLGVDAYLSGEVAERTYDLARELDVHYFACGHYASERYGIKALGEHLALKFSLECQFVETNNSI
jgi:dinuclear metal center YbgI/SA1388 family protein